MCFQEARIVQIDFSAAFDRVGHIEIPFKFFSRVHPEWPHR